ncbi:TerB family tellurite resistance protein [Gloeobacter kilaueensis]|uniref:Co-chaperone DjlA N-terminal domain-containing protein n=1 Tax=Gloeobacter kilaueensis (strain ATCC BAA-2537 / CCAP 1431/1 / ULC 316 / JS1) TaxID=1183438 RepID=U5QQN0_GLOK1|nr:TerB family tellurite resistance protein [Gloeobacter kilaueensis]AGY59924.1 hypothetical protein GKIL_3678 [Gloeobacter kilaueensis JS1]
MNNAAIAFRLLVAAAWSDGQLHPSEALLLAQYLPRLNLPFEEQQHLLEYLQIRPAVDTAQIWLQEVQAARLDPTESRELTESLKLIVYVDGRLAPEEAQLLAQLSHALEASEPPSLLARLKLWLKRLTGRPD